MINSDVMALLDSLDDNLEVKFYDHLTGHYFVVAAVSAPDGLFIELSADIALDPTIYPVKDLRPQPFNPHQTYTTEELINTGQYYSS